MIIMNEYEHLTLIFWPFNPGTQGKTTANRFFAWSCVMLSSSAARPYDQTSNLQSPPQTKVNLLFSVLLSSPQPLHNKQHVMILGLW